MLAVLGVADAEQLFEALDAVVAHDPAAALRTAARLTGSGRDPGQILRDLEIHGRELLAVQVLGEVPEELRITPERDQRLLTQAQSLAETDAVRLLDLVAAALEATANGAQARIQLELVLIKAAAPEVDPSTAALLARIERLEAALSGAAPAPAARVAPRPRRPAARPHPAPAAARRRRAPAQPEPAPSPPPSRRARRPSRARAARAPTPATRADQPANGRRSAPARAGHAAAAEPSPSAPPPGIVPGARPELQTVRACWPAVIDLVRQENQMLAALLADARPVSLTDQGVTLAFPAGKAFLKRKAEQDDYRRATAEALRSVIGTTLVLRYELREEAELPELAADADGLSQEELVKRLVEEFDAQEVLDDPDSEEK